MNDYVWPGVFQKSKNSRAIAYVDLVVLVSGYLIPQSPQ